MNQPPTAYPCPACGAPATLSSGCPRCGRAPDPTAAEVVRLDGEITVLAGRVERARQEVERARQGHVTLTETLRDTRRRRDELAARVRTAVFVSRPPVRPPGFAQPQLPQPSMPAPPPVPPVSPVSPVPPASAPGGRPEASTRTVQNLLFILGGLLVGTAAVIFTVVAWSTVGIAGRAAILAVLTGLALGAPLLAKSRGLTATAETFAALGLLLVVLDGYAIWAVDLFGVTGLPAARYAALVGGASAAVAAGYGVVTRLAAPWFAAFLAAQPVLPLLASTADLGLPGWGLLFATLAALDLAIVGHLRRPRVARSSGIALARQITAWFGYGCALLYSAGCGLGALLTGAGPGPAAILSGLPLVVVALLLLAAALLVRQTVLQAIAGGLLVVTIGAGAIRPVAETNWPFLVVTALIVTLLCAAVLAAGRLLPAGVRTGPRVGALLLAAPLAVAVTTMGLTVAAVLALRSLPGGRSATGPVDIFDWQLPVAVPLVTAALAILLPRVARQPVTLLGGVLTLLVAPATAGLPWWGIAGLELLVAAPLLVFAVRSVSPRPLLPLLCAGSGAVLAGHALAVGFARPAGAATVLAVLVLLGLAVAAIAGAQPALRMAGQSAPTMAGHSAPGAEPAVTPAAAQAVVPAYRRVIGGLCLGVGLVLVPAAVAAGLHAGGVVPWWQARAALAAVVLLAVAPLAVRRRWPGYLAYAVVAVGVAAMITGLAPGVTGVDEPAGVYAAIGLLVVTAGLLVTAGPVVTAGLATASRAPAAGALWFAGAVLLLRAAIAVAPAVFGVLGRPYGWLGQIWTGLPDGVGLAPGGVRIAASSAGTLAVLTVVAAIGGWLWRRTRFSALLAALPVGAVALLVVLAAAGAHWPTVPAVALAVGLGCLLLGSLASGGSRVTPVTVPLGLILGGSGMVGLLPLEASTITALGLVVAVTATIGAVARSGPTRVAGALAAVTAGGCLVLTAASAADLPLRVAALGVLGVAAAALAVGTGLRGRRPVQAVALEAAGHSGAVVALLLSVGDIRYAAAVCTLWGVALGLRALRPGESAGRRWVFAACAAGSEVVAVWLVLISGDVAVLEAYTAPAAALALIAGWLAVRARPALNSWLAYGPGLAAALLPSLASVLAAGDQPWRRLLLGTAALLVVLLGARWRRQAPVVLGGGTLAVQAVYELVVVWDRLPRWVFLAVGGFALIGLAISYERRRRDVARLRSAVGRMT